MRLREGARHLTAVRTVLGLYEYCVMAMELKGASAFFQKLVSQTYEGFLVTGEEGGLAEAVETLAAFLDDLTVGRTRRRHTW